MRQSKLALRQYEEFSNYVRKGQQTSTKKTDDIAIPDDLSKRLLTALETIRVGKDIPRCGCKYR